MEVKAIDLNLTDDSFQQFEVGNKIQCVSTPNGLDSTERESHGSNQMNIKEVDV